MALDDTKWNPEISIEEDEGKRGCKRDEWVIEQMRCVPMPPKAIRLILIEIAALVVIDIIEDMIKWRKPE